jgi:hypothetical protein
MRGRKNVRKLTALGETRTVAEWAAISKVPRELIYNRIQKGMTADQALFTPVKERAKKKSKKGQFVDTNSQKVIMGLIGKERVRNYRFVGMWYRIFMIEDGESKMKAA